MRINTNYRLHFNLQIYPSQNCEELARTLRNENPRYFNTRENIRQKEIKSNKPNQTIVS